MICCLLFIICCLFAVRCSWTRTGTRTRTRTQMHLQTHEHTQTDTRTDTQTHTQTHSRKNGRQHHPKKERGTAARSKGGGGRKQHHQKTEGESSTNRKERARYCQNQFESFWLALFFTCIHCNGPSLPSIVTRVPRYLRKQLSRSLQRPRPCPCPKLNSQFMYLTTLVPAVTVVPDDDEVEHIPRDLEAVQQQLWQVTGDEHHHSLLFVDAPRRARFMLAFRACIRLEMNEPEAFATTRAECPCNRVTLLVSGFVSRSAVFHCCTRPPTVCLPAHALCTPPKAAPPK